MKTTYPVLLEAVLRAEEAILDSELQAGRALEGASLVGAVDAEAHLLRGRLSHGGRSWRGTTSRYATR